MQVDYSISRQHANKKVFSGINPTVTQKQFKTVPTCNTILRRNVKKLIDY